MFGLVWVSLAWDKIGGATMKSELLKLCLFVLLSTGITVIMEPREHVPLEKPGNNFNEAFGMCLSKKEHGMLECVNRAILSALQSLNDKDSLDFGKVRLDRAEGYGRDLLDLDYDPKDFGNVVKAAARLMERRNVKWNLDHLYPGLQMRVGPMLNGEGLLEFVLNERTTSSYNDRQAGPGRLQDKYQGPAKVRRIFSTILSLTKRYMSRWIEIQTLPTLPVIFTFQAINSASVKWTNFRELFILQNRPLGSIQLENLRRGWVTLRCETSVRGEDSWVSRGRVLGLLLPKQAK